MRYLFLSPLLLFSVFLFNSGRSTIHCTSNSPSQDSDSIVIMDQITDSLSLGKPGQYKVDIQKLEGLEQQAVMQFKLFSKIEGSWVLLQSEELDISAPGPLYPKFSDFNNDGFKDLTVRSGEAARGANEIRTLYIFNKTTNKLVKVRNSANYPNLQFNRDLNCIDAWLVYGGSSTVFLKLEADTLREFAGVYLTDIERTVELIDKRGKSRVIRKDKIKETDVYTRYSNFNPLKINKSLD